MATMATASANPALDLKEHRCLADMSVMRKPDFCLCENKDADQLCSNCTADQHLCFRLSDSTIPLLLKSKIPRVYLSSVTVQLGLCRAWLETPKTGFLASQLTCISSQITVLSLSHTLNITFKQCMSCIVTKQTFCICKNKGANQLRSNCQAYQRHCFCYTNSIIPLLS